MSTLTGVIKASTKIGTDAVPAESDLWINSGMVLFTTPAFPHFLSEEMQATSKLDKFIYKKQPKFGDLITSGAAVSKIEKIRVVKYLTFEQKPTDFINAGCGVLAIAKNRVVKYSTHFQPPEDFIEATAYITSISKLRVAGYIDLRSPHDELKASAHITNIQKVRK